MADKNLFWQVSLDRATSFVTTNGNIQVTLCGLYATATAVLLTVVQEESDATKALAFTYVIPTLSVIIYILSSNVYNWIVMQIKYISTYGTWEAYVGPVQSYEEWKGEVKTFWYSKNVLAREFRYFIDVFMFIIKMPLRTNHLYAYYFMIYLISPHASLAYINNGINLKGSLLLVAIQVLITALSCRDTLICNNCSDEYYNTVRRPKPVPVPAEIGEAYTESQPGEVTQTEA